MSVRLAHCKSGGVDGIKARPSQDIQNLSCRGTLCAPAEQYTPLHRTGTPSAAITDALQANAARG